METLQPAPPSERNPDDLPPQDPWAETAQHASEHYQIPQNTTEGTPSTETQPGGWKDLKEPQDPWQETQLLPNATTQTEVGSLPPLDIMTPDQEAARMREIEDNFDKNGAEPQYNSQDTTSEYTPRHLRLNDEPFVSDPIGKIEHRREQGFKATVDLANSLQETNPELKQGINDYLENTPLPPSDRPPASPDAFTKADATMLRDRLAEAPEQQQAPAQPEQAAQPENYQGRHRKLGRIASWFAKLRG